MLQHVIDNEHGVLLGGWDGKEGGRGRSESGVAPCERQGGHQSTARRQRRDKTPDT